LGRGGELLPHWAKPSVGSDRVKETLRNKTNTRSLELKEKGKENWANLDGLVLTERWGGSILQITPKSVDEQKG